jgi:hypothetical protein
MKNLIVAAVVSAFSLGAVAASHTEKGASAPMAKPMAAAASAPASAAKATKTTKAKKMKKAASAA